MISMRKTYFKKILQLLDELEHNELSLKETTKMLYAELMQLQYDIHSDELFDLVMFLIKQHCLLQFHFAIDLNPVSTIYARSSLHSDIEAMAAFEMFITSHLKDYQNLLQGNHWYHEKQLSQMFEDRILDILLQTSLFEKQEDQYRIRLSLRKNLSMIINEYQTRSSLYLSSVLLAKFTDSIIPHSSEIEYRNEDRSMVNYSYQKDILTTIPKRGIPSNRDITKALQSFYKDTLFHEFEHQCPLCHIHLPHMLIASHIKPFRDCAHIYEPIDHNNGLLLCRNHDYLFDQGYFSFNDDGSLLMCDEFMQHEPFDAFNIKKDFKLPNRYLSEERKAFLAYHRKNIYKK